MQKPKSLYNLRYYARRKGYAFIPKTRIVTVPEKGRSAKVEERLTGFGYGIQLNLFAEDGRIT